MLGSLRTEDITHMLESVELVMFTMSPIYLTVGRHDFGKGNVSTLRLSFEPLAIYAGGTEAIESIKVQPSDMSLLFRRGSENGSKPESDSLHWRTTTGIPLQKMLQFAGYPEHVVAAHLDFYRGTVCANMGPHRAAGHPTVGA